MKHITLTLIIVTNLLFSYEGNIDMHGGKTFNYTHTKKVKKPLSMKALLGVSSTTTDGNNTVIAPTVKNKVK